MTGALLELAVRLAWWNRDTITIGDKQIFLLPALLVSQEQTAVG